MLINKIIINIHLYNKYYAVLYVFEDDIFFPISRNYELVGLKDLKLKKYGFASIVPNKGRSLRIVTSALFLQPFVKACRNSEVYRYKLLENLGKIYNDCNGNIFLKLVLKPPDREIIDYAWNNRIQTLVWTRVEIENSFSWLSTLGGAYSALGDEYEHFAEAAGRISHTQYKLSMMLGDDSLAARSVLYSAFSYAQKGQLKKSRHIVRYVVQIAQETKDGRLLKMCKGGWAYLKYLRANQKKSKEMNKIINGKVSLPSN